jgi:hypothetical protein
MYRGWIAELKLEDLHTKQWDCKLMFNPSLDDTILEVDLLNFINPPVGISNMGSSELLSRHLYRFPSCYSGVDDWKELNLIYTTVEKMWIQISQE